MSGNVNVEVDNRSDQVDLSKVLEEMREQYESAMVKNKQDQEKWFNAKVRNSPMRRSEKIEQMTVLPSFSACLFVLRVKDGGPPNANCYENNGGEDAQHRAVRAEEVLPELGDNPPEPPHRGSTDRGALSL